MSLPKSSSWIPKTKVLNFDPISLFIDDWMIFVNYSLFCYLKHIWIRHKEWLELYMYVFVLNSSPSRRGGLLKVTGCMVFDGIIKKKSIPLVKFMCFGMNK